MTVINLPLLPPPPLLLPPPPLLLLLLLVTTPEFLLLHSNALLLPLVIIHPLQPDASLQLLFKLKPGLLRLRPHVKTAGKRAKQTLGIITHLLLSDLLLFSALLRHVFLRFYLSTHQGQTDMSAAERGCFGAQMNLALLKLLHAQCLLLSGGF